MNYDLIYELVGDGIESILDIGAHQGLFTKSMRYRYPFAQYHMIEANEHCEPYLKDVGFVDYTICLLSDREKPITYYVNKENTTSTGNSYYKELTEHFSEETCISVLKQATTLDNLFVDKTFDFIKIDTQGSELDILKGGTHLVSQAKYVLLECSVEPYNEGAPLIDEVESYVNSLGFLKVATVGQHVINSKITQQDTLFYKPNN